MDNTDKPIFKQSEIAKIKGVSRSYVTKSVKGDIKTQKAEEIMEMLSITQSDVIEILKDDRFYRMCEVAIDRAKVDKEIRKFAVLCQQFHSILNKSK